MKHTYDGENFSLSISLEEEIDMNSCKVLRNVIDGYIMRYQPKECIIDLKKVSFMDSSGIGLIIGRYNLIKLLNSRLIVANPSSNIKRVLELSSVSKDIILRGE